MGLLYGQAGRDFYTNEIIRLTNIGTGAVQRELEKLTAVGLLVVTQMGNQKRYQANHNSPLFQELRSIVLKTFGLTDVLLEALTPQLDKIKIAFIYGSIARQEDTLKSDIDLMIISENLTYADLFQILLKAETQFGRKINPTIYSPSEWTRKFNDGNHFVINVIKQEKIYLVGSEHELEKVK